MRRGVRAGAVAVPGQGRRGGFRTPAEDGVNGGSAGVALEGVGEHDEDDDCRPPDCCPETRRVHAHDVTADVVAKGEVACDGY